MTKIVKHDTYYPKQSETDRKRLLLSDGTRQWTHWAEANQQQALLADVYSQMHP